ncbi:Protein kinase-like (PK-like) [Glarea lozoyensis ATCC 20868]|uniref:Protein kinase-like (PK-like) n=1 Tax=Glarea lozoyensis (strain ATCC 20868 / MF5171) TaxID=1116229 RepID=S3DD39_GLAL2|nr:Protein kinase-like (PK-like) [Glarea lozoyensis ATCC 20868]EPE35019.1 Protein kinase-like (PK-like) [Glarea lozoyensis ATCC 20868]
MDSSKIAPENFQQPDEFYKGLGFKPGRGRQSKELMDRRCHLDKMGQDFQHHELCWSCGWSTNDQLGSTYGSRVRILMSRHNRGLWALGSQLLLKDIPNDGHGPGNDYITYRWLRSQSGLDIPLLDRMEVLSKPTDKTYLLLMSRAEGEPLTNLWHKLLPEQKESLRGQLFLILKQLRIFTALGAQDVEGGKLDDLLIGDCPVPRPRYKKIGFTADKWFESLKSELQVGLAKKHKTKDMTIIEAEYQKLKGRFPNPEPYVLTHGDLDFSNIIVKDNQITAIIDWEHAGYYPWWAEHYLCGDVAFGQSSSLLFPVLYRLDPGMEARIKDVYNKVLEVRGLWESCKREHPHYHDRWYRPPFSACEPYAGHFLRGVAGGIQEREHTIQDLNLLNFE